MRAAAQSSRSALATMAGPPNHTFPLREAARWLHVGVTLRAMAIRAGILGTGLVNSELSQCEPVRATR
jgi:hypothetical protein